MKNKKEKGITLVALVITIVILLILAGISISTLTNTGIFEKAKKAKNKSQESQDLETIKLAMYSIKLSEYSDKEAMKIGEQLYDKNLENGSKWHIIVMKNSDKIYGTGYTFLPKNSNIEDTNLKCNWIIENSTQNTIKLEDDSFTELSYESAIGVKDGLIFNLDPSIIENATQENINEKLGENVELVNFDWNEDSGLTKTSFNLDGVNDYIKIKYDNEEEKNKLAENGLSFEFYGIYNGGTSYNSNNVAINNVYKGLFCYWNGLENKQAGARFGITSTGKRIVWNTGGYSKTYISDYSESDYPWNIMYPESELIENNKEIHFIISIDCSQENFKHTLFVNGEKLYEGNLNKDYWNSFVNSKLGNLKYFCVGRSSMDADGKWHYSKMNAYSLKLYNRGLSEQEVKENYNKAVAYHNTLQ